MVTSAVVAAYHQHLAYCDLAQYCGFLETAAIIMAAASGRQFAGQEIRDALFASELVRAKNKVDHLGDGDNLYGKDKTMNEKTRKDFIELLSRCTEKNRRTTMGIVGDRVSTNDVNYVKEELQFMSPDDMTPREVTLVVSAMCDCGKVLSQKNVLQGRCQYPGCTRYVCSDCSRVCCRCERTVCSQHSKRYGDGEIYCIRCRPIKWLKIFLDVGAKEKEK